MTGAPAQNQPRVAKSQRRPLGHYRSGPIWFDRAWFAGYMHVTDSYANQHEKPERTLTGGFRQDSCTPFATDNTGVQLQP